VWTRCADHATPLYQQNLAITLPAVCQPVDIFRLRTKGHVGFLVVLFFVRPVAGCGGLCGFAMSRIPHLLDSRLTDADKLVSLIADRSVPPKYTWFLSLLEGGANPEPSCGWKDILVRSKTADNITFYPSRHHNMSLLSETSPQHVIITAPDHTIVSEWNLTTASHHYTPLAIICPYWVNLTKVSHHNTPLATICSYWAKPHHSMSLLPPLTILSSVSGPSSQPHYRRNK
jgi:hypothetical protein